jgi:hypothetical protein
MTASHDGAVMSVRHAIPVTEIRGFTAHRLLLLPVRRRR